MIIIGCDFHPSTQTLAWKNPETGECGGHELRHDGEAQAFYRNLRGQVVRVGMEATGHARWFERWLAECGVELWVADAARVRAAATRKQKTDKRDADDCGSLVGNRKIIAEPSFLEDESSPTVNIKRADTPRISASEYLTDLDSQSRDNKRDSVVDITNCNSIIANRNMKLGEKLRYLRLVEGTLRGLEHEMTQQGLAAAIKKELGRGLSQSYLSQIESGARPHLTNASRMLLARFFKVHPGYLVDDPEGYHTELTSDLRAREDRLDLWLINGAEQFARDSELSEALVEVAKYRDSRRCLVLLGAILEAPELVERLTEVLKPSLSEPVHRGAGKRRSAGAKL